MENRIKDRLIEAAKFVEGQPEFKIAVWEGGILLQLIWEGRDGQFYTTDNFTPWQAIENATMNPLIPGLSSLTKQRAGHQ